MSREFLIEVLDRFAKVTSIIVETSKIKEDLDHKSHVNLKEIFKRTEAQVESLAEHADTLKEFFQKHKAADSAEINGKDCNENSEQTETVENEENDGANAQTNKPLIKLVDINKLVEPRSILKQTVKNEKEKPHLDDSVVIITSSDEEASRTPRRSQKVSPKKTNSVSKSRLRTPPNRRKSTGRAKFGEAKADSDPDKVGSKKKLKNGRRRTNILENAALKDSSSSDDSSDSESTTSSIKKKTPKDKSESGQDTEIDWKTDTKFNSQCYVKVLRVPCEKLKEYYLEKLELLEINKLRDLTPLSRKRVRFELSPTSKTDKKRKQPSNKKMSSSDEDSSLTEDGLDVSKTDSIVPETSEAPKMDVDLANIAAEDALARLNSDKEDENESGNSGDEGGDKNNEAPKKNGEENIEETVKETAVEDNTEKTENETPPNDDNNDTNTNQEENQSSDKNDSSTPDKDEENKKDDEHTSDHSEKEENKEDKDKDKEKKKWRKDKLLTAKLSSTDSEDDEKKIRKKKHKSKDASSDDEPKTLSMKKKRSKRRRLKAIIDSDSDAEKDSGNEFQPEEKSSSSEPEEKEPEKPKRKRVKRVHDSSDDEEKSTRKQIRHILDRDSLAETTKKAEAEERERKARLAEKQKKYNQLYEADTMKNASVDKIVLDYDEKNNKELLRVHDDLVSKLKPHQASGIQFMWDACFESLERAKNTIGSGCILAHCMGLGKTLQVITLCHTLLTHSEVSKVKKVLVVCPLNTVLNWVNEFKQWLPDEDDFDIFELVSVKQNFERQYEVKKWHVGGGVLIIGYDMFRNLSNPENKRLSRKMRAVFQEALVDPGPDLVVCDEGHLLKNEKTNLSVAMNRIKTLRRIILTGTPLQNNLKEYFCMVQFIKPNLLGTYKEYLNRFVNPITNGQYTDSTLHDIQIMRKRSHVLHKLLDGVVQRRDYSVLEPYLPPKFEYVIFLKLSEVQIKLYQHYLDKFARRNLDGSNRTSFLFVDFQALQRICTHPRVLLDKSIEMKLAKEKQDESEDSEGSLKDFINDDEDEEESSSGNSSSDGSDQEKQKSAPRKRVTRAAAALAKENGEEEEAPLELMEPRAKEWWQDYCDGDELNVINHSSKLFMLFEILKECEQIGDKVLVFSQSLYSLNVIEYFMERIHEATQAGNTDSAGGYSGSWCIGLDYFRLDGSSSCDNRNTWCNLFNDPENTRARLFLISTKAGGLGINLYAANRVVIFDVSWNPSHDVQSIYRVYRFGQTKPCYIYRFVTYGTMEMKIYERQVTKQAISKRVIDEQQIDRHYNQNDLAELYRFEPDPGERPIPLVPKDVLLGELLQKFENRVYKYHEHQTLLENKADEVLNEEERKAAWEEFENEKKQRNNWGNANVMRIAHMELALMSIVRKENPECNEMQLRAMVPTVHSQMQEQVSRGDLTLYRRVQQEMQVILALQASRMTQQFQHEQMIRAIQKRQMMEAKRFHQVGNISGHQVPSTSHASNSIISGDIIELND